jgi:hypothetical protein
MRLDVKRTVECPNPEYGGTQDVGDCCGCSLFGGLSNDGEEMQCGYYEPE